MSEFITIQPTDERPDGWPSYCKYSSPDFEKHSLVRIFLSYVGYKKIFVKEGLVTDTNREKKGDPCLELLLQRSGSLIENENYEIVAPRHNGFVYGSPDLIETTVRQTSSYGYMHIILAQVQK